MNHDNPTYVTLMNLFKTLHTLHINRFSYSSIIWTQLLFRGSFEPFKCHALIVLL